MDAIVRAALDKWPNVPACYGWLALDARGDWYMRDDRVQAQGAFPQVRGSRIEHEKLRGFIERNYASEHGAWFFQNGPQRVYVELEAAPWIWRLPPGTSEPRIVSHTGHEGGAVESVWLDERGRLFVIAETGFGLVHSQDVLAASEWVERGMWAVEEIAFDALIERAGCCLSPAALAAAKR